MELENVPNNVYYDDFKTGKEVIVNLLNKILSQGFENKNTKFNLSFIGPIIIDTSTNANHDLQQYFVTAEELYEILLKKWQEEAMFEKKFIECKNNIDKIFGTLPNQEHILNLRNDLVDTLVVATQVENRSAIQEFCIGLLNGFDNEIGTNIIKVIQNIIINSIYYWPGDIISQINSINENNADKIIKDLIENIIKESKIIQLEENASNSDLDNVMKYNKFCQLKIKIEESRKLEEFTDLLSYLHNPQFRNHIESIEIYCENNLQVLVELLKVSGFMKCKLIQLNSLDISNQIVDLWSRCLDSLSVSSTYFLDVSLLNLEKILNRKNSLLQELDLNLENNECAIQGQYFASFVRSLQNNPKLRRLTFNFRKNNIEIKDKHFQEFAKLLKIMTNLECLQFYLDTDNNYAVGDGGIIELANSLNYLKLLTTFHLQLRDNPAGVKDNGFKRLAEALTNISSIRDISLDFRGNMNCISDHGFIFFAKNIKNFNKLDSLYLNFRAGMNSISDKSIQILIDNLIQFDSISKIHLNFAEGLHEIKEKSLLALAETKIKLKHLGLSFWKGNNAFYDTGLSSFCQIIARSVGLVNLTLYFGHGKNVVTEKGLQECALAIKLCNLLQYLRLGFEGPKKQNN